MARKEPIRTRVIYFHGEGETFADRYLLEESLGGDAMTEVWLAQDQEENRQVVLKILRQRAFVEDENWERWLHVLRRLKGERCEFLIPVLHAEEVNEEHFWVVQYCEPGSVSQKSGSLSEQELARLMLQVGTALHTLHKVNPPVFHQGIKPNNVLIDSHGNYCLTDPSLSLLRRETASADPQYLEEVAYLAPECWRGIKVWGKSCDIFAFGVMLYEIATGTLPLGREGGKALLNGSGVPNLPKRYSPRFNQILQVCMAREPEGRPSAEILARLAEQYLEEGEWKSVAGFSFAANFRYRRGGFRNLIPKINIKPQTLKWAGIGIGSIAIILALVFTRPWESFFQSSPSNTIETEQNPPVNIQNPSEIDFLMEARNEVKTQLMKLKASDQDLNAIDKQYLNVISKRLDKFDTQASEYLQTNSDVSRAEWKPGKKDEQWLEKEKEQLEKYVMNLKKIQDRIEKRKAN